MGRHGIYAEFIKRTAERPGLVRGRSLPRRRALGRAGLWMNSWYDVSIGPNLALFNHIDENAEAAEVRNNQYVVIAPTPHCRFQTEEEETIVGERNMGDVRLDYDGLIARWFDYWLKGEDERRAGGHGRRSSYYTMGSNEWQSSADLAAGRRRDDHVVSRQRRSRQQPVRRRPSEPTTPPTVRPRPDRFSYDPQPCRCRRSAAASAAPAGRFSRARSIRGASRRATTSSSTPASR